MVDLAYALNQANTNANALRPITDGVVQQFYDEKTVTLAAGERLPVFTNYNYFRVLSLSGSGLNVIFGNNQYQTPYTGAGIGLRFEYVLPRFELVNTSGAPLTLTYAVAVGVINDDRLTVSGTVTVAGAVTVSGTVSTTSSSTLNSIADVTISVASRTAIVTANAARRGVIITNIGANVTRVGDATTTSATRGAQLLPNQSITLETLDAVSGYSTLGTSVSVLEY